MKRFIIDFSGSVSINANSENEAEDIFASSPVKPEDCDVTKISEDTDYEPA